MNNRREFLLGTLVAGGFALLPWGLPAATPEVKVPLAETFAELKQRHSLQYVPPRTAHDEEINPLWVAIWIVEDLNAGDGAEDERFMPSLQSALKELVQGADGYIRQHPGGWVAMTPPTLNNLGDGKFEAFIHITRDPTAVAPEKADLQLSPRTQERPLYEVQLLPYQQRQLKEFAAASKAVINKPTVYDDSNLAMSMALAAQLARQSGKTALQGAYIDAHLRDLGNQQQMVIDPVAE